MMKLLNQDYDDETSRLDKDELIDDASAVDLSPVMRKPFESADGQQQNGDNQQHLVTFLNGDEANPYLDAFYAVLSQVLDTPYQKTFFNVLQHLREIHLLRHPSAGSNDYVWEILEKFISRLKLLRSANEARELFLHLCYDQANNNGYVGGAATNMIGSSDSLNSCCCTCHHREEASSSKAAPILMTVGQPPSPPPLPPPQPIDNRKSIESRRPTFAEMISTAATTASLKSSSSDPAPVRPSTFLNRNVVETSSPAPPPPPPTSSSSSSVVDDRVVVLGAKLLPQQNLPQPKTKLKTFAWSKVPASKIVENVNNTDNVWLKAASRFDTAGIISAINFDDLELLFAAQTSSPSNTIERGQRFGGGQDNNSNGPTTPNAISSASNRFSGGDFNSLTNGAGDGTGTLGRRRDASSDVNLLDPKRSLNVNIFLKQFRGGIDDLIELIETGDSHYLGLEKLRGLTKILPEPDELEALKAYAGDKCKLGNAERFFLALIDISNYRLRVDSMLLKEEFLSMVDYMKPSVNTLIAAARDLKNSQSLQEVLYLLLLVGNYLNAGGYGGNAVGFKMTSLWKLVEIRANKPNVTLLHYVVAEVEKRNARLLELPKELKHLDEASKLSFDTILSDFRHLKEKTDRISKQVAETDADDEIRHQTEIFFEFAKGELIKIERDISQVDRLRLDLAAFFCEDAHTFKLEECFKIFATFCQRFARAIDENTERRLQEEKAELRRRLREQQKAKKEFTLTQRVSFNETESSRRLSDKYKSLLNTNDVILPYQDGDSGGNTLNLVDVLTTTTAANSASTMPNCRKSVSGDEESSLESEFSTGSAFWRRSYNCKRRGAPAITSSSFTNRERPRDLDVQQQQSTTTPWRQRFEELLADNERPANRTAHSASSSELDALCNSRQQGQTSSIHASNVDKPVECSPIFAKTFPRRDTTRIASVNDLDQFRTPSLASINQETSQAKLGGPPVEMKRSVWREQRRIRANSLLTDVGEGGAASASANDLNELLEILKIENGSNAAARRRVSNKLTLVTSESGDDEAAENQTTTPPSSDAPTTKTDIDEVVRHCEQARKEIDSMGHPVPTSNSSPPIENNSPEKGNDSEECSADFTLSASDIPDCTSCNLVISCRGDIRADDSTIDGQKVSLLATAAPTTTLSEIMLLDEGFEEDASNSTNCSSVTGVQSPPLLPASPKLNPQQTRRPTTNVNAAIAKSTPKSRPALVRNLSTTASQTKFSYQSGTKSSVMKLAPNSQKPSEPRPSQLNSRRSSISMTADQNSNSQSRPIPISAISASKSKQPDPNSPKSNIGFQSRRPVANGHPAKPVSAIGNQSRNAKIESRSTSSSEISKTRIQNVAARSLLQRQRISISNGNSSSSSSSDSEQQRSSKNPPPRKRAPSTNVAKEQATTRKPAAAKISRGQQTSVLITTQRNAASNFRTSIVRKNGAE